MLPLRPTMTDLALAARWRVGLVSPNMDLREEKYIAFTTYRRTGEPVTSPVWLAPLADGTYGFWTSSGSGKAKRLAHTARVNVQPSDARGQVSPGTAAIEAQAHLVSAGDAAYEEIVAQIKTKYGLMTKVTRLLGTIGGIAKRNRIPYGDRGVVISLPPGAENGSSATS